METTSGYASWVNGNNKTHNRNIHKMVKSGLLGINQHEKNCGAKQRHQKNSIDANLTVH